MRLLLSLFVATLHLCVVAQLCNADTASNAVVRITSRETAGCGTGFFLDNGSTVLTNVHVADLVCRGNSCHQIILERGVGAEHEKVASEPLEMRVLLRLPSIDAALLALPEGTRSESFLELSSGPPRPGESIRMIGFPACKALQESTGSVSNLDTVSFSSGAVGASGSSGSPILRADGKVVGLAFQADSLARALYDKFHGGSFTLRAVRADLISALRASVSPGARLAEYELLLRYYRNEVANAEGLTRVTHALYFLNALRTSADVAADESGDSEILRSAALLDHFPGAILQLTTPAPSSPAAVVFEQLVFASNLESRGAFVSFTEPLTAELLTKVLAEQRRPPEQISALVAMLPKADAATSPGLAPLGAVTGVAAGGLVLLLLLAWGWSAGYVYATATGGRTRRLLKMITVAVLFWPISLIFFRLFRKRGR